MSYIQFHIILLIFLIPAAMTGQQPFAAGLLEEDEVYDTLNRMKAFDGAKTTLPPKISLKAYCPEVRHQGEIFSCVGWSVGYSALTIQKAIQYQVTDRRVITHNAHSALFIYNQIKQGECRQGSRISDALGFLKENGDCLARDFDFDVNDCEKLPEKPLTEKAKSFAIKDYKTLFATEDDPRLKVRQVKLALTQNKPVIIGMTVRRNFYLLKNAVYWWPENGNTTAAGGHAMVVVGYDDNRGAFRLMNSWGKNWGDRGFIWVKYPDFGRFCKYAYILFLNGDNKPSIQGEPVSLADEGFSNPKNVLVGNIQIKYVSGRSRVSGAPVFNQAKARLMGNHYYLENENWQVGQLFQVIANSPKREAYLYVFSVDARQDTHLHWPPPNQPESALIFQDKTGLIIPGPHKALKLTQKGKEHLIILFSTKKINGLSKLMDILSNQKDNLPQAVWATLGKHGVPKHDIVFDMKSIGFQANTREVRYIVPIILEMDIY